MPPEKKQSSGVKTVTDPETLAAFHSGKAKPIDAGDNVSRETNTPAPAPANVADDATMAAFRSGKAKPINGTPAASQPAAAEPVPAQPQKDIFTVDPNKPITNQTKFEGRPQESSNIELSDAAKVMQKLYSGDIAGGVEAAAQLQKSQVPVTPNTIAKSREDVGREVNSPIKFIENDVNHVMNSMPQEAQSFLTSMGVDKENFAKQVLSTDGSGQKALSAYYNARLELLKGQKKQELAGAFPQKPIGYEFTAADQKEYATKSQAIDDKYGKLEQNFKEASQALAAVKVVNDHMKQIKDPSKIEPYMVGRDIEKILNGESDVANDEYASLHGQPPSPTKAVGRMLAGYQAIQFAAAKAHADGDDVTAKKLFDKAENYPQKIMNDVPEYAIQQKAAALSNVIYKATNPFVRSITGYTGGVSKETINAAAKSLGWSEEDVKDIKPEDITTVPNILARAVGGLLKGVEPAGEFVGRALLKGQDALSLTGLTNPVDWKMVNWSDRNQDIFGDTKLGKATGLKLPEAATELTEAPQVRETDKASPNFLFPKKNEKGGEFTWDAGAIVGHAAEAAGDLVSFLTEAGVAGKVLKGGNVINNVAKADRVGAAATMFTNTYHDAYKNSFAAIGDKPEDEVKRHVYAAVNASIATATQEILPLTEFKTQILGTGTLAGKEFVDLINKKGVQYLAENSGTVKNLIINGVKKAAEDEGKMIGIAELNNIGTNITNALFNPNSGSKVFDNTKETAISAGIGMAIPSILAGISHPRAQSKLMKDMFFQVGSNPEIYTAEISKLMKDGKMAEAEGNKALSLVGTMSNIVKTSIPTEDIQSGRQLTPSQRSEYANNLLQQALANGKKAGLKDEVQLAHLDKFITDLQTQRGEILSKAGEPEPIMAEPVEEPVANENAIATFKTAKGSTYQVHDDGTTTRNKAARPDVGHEGDFGQKERSQSTVYLTREELAKLDIVQTEGWPDGVQPTVKRDPNTGNVGVILRGGPNDGKHIKGSVFKPTSEPGIGLYPLEIWKDGYHFGNEIVEINRPEPKSSTLEHVVTPVAPEHTISIGELMDKQVTYKGEPATLRLEGQTVVAETAKRIYDIGNVDEVSGHSIKDYGLEQLNNVVAVNDAGNITVRDAEYHNNYSDPTKAINYDADGNVVSVNLETATGEKRTFRSNVAEDIAYQIKLKEYEKTNRIPELEQFINSDESTRELIDATRPEEVAPEATTGDNEQVRQTLERKPVETIATAPDLFSQPQNTVNHEEHANQTEPGQGQERPISIGQEAQLNEHQPNTAQEGGQVGNDGQGQMLNGTTEGSRKPAADRNSKKAESIFGFAPELEEEPEYAAAQREKPAPQPVAPIPTTAVAEAPVVDKQAEADKFFYAQQTPEEQSHGEQVGPNIKTKWDTAEKELGRSDTRILSDGSKLPGRYVLTEAEVPTASHDPFNGNRSSEGFPVDAEGKNVNDRDYTRKENSGREEARSKVYDGRAAQNVPTVDKNGVVIDGNGRTQARQLAAAEGDGGAKEYIDALKEKADVFGFSPEQIDQMVADGKHPYVVFVPDRVLPYTTETFAKFNPHDTDTKVKSPIEEAITFGRTLGDKVLERIGNIMSNKESLADFFKSKPDRKAVLEILKDEGIITSDNVLKYYSDETGFTTAGKEMLQNMMLGKAFDEPTLRLLEQYPGVRQKMVYALSNIVSIEALGSEYSLKENYSEALHMKDTLDQFMRENNIPFERIVPLGENKFTKEDNHDEGLKQFMEQGRMFGDFSDQGMILWAVFENGKTNSLRDFTRDYAEKAKEYADKNKVNIFGDVNPTREEILRDAIKNQKEYEFLQRHTERGDVVEPGQPDTGGSEQGVQGGDRSTEKIPTEEPTGPVVDSPQPEQPANSEEPQPEQPKAQEEVVPPSENPELTHAVGEYNRFNKAVHDKIAALERMENEGVGKGDERFKRKQAELSNAYANRKIWATNVKKAEGKMPSDAIRSLKDKIADDLIMSTPFSPKLIKKAIDLVADLVKAGENVVQAIRKAIVKLREDHSIVETYDEKELEQHLTEQLKYFQTDSSVKPTLESPKNKSFADNIISKIKSGDLSIENAIDGIHNLNLSEDTRNKIVDYVKHYTAPEASEALRDRNNPQFLDDYKLETSDKVQQFMSGKTLYDIFGETPEGNQDYTVNKLSQMLDDGDRMLTLAQHHFGEDVMSWGPKLLEAVKDMPSDDTNKKAVLLATMLGRLNEEKIRNPEREAQINKVLQATNEYWQTFIRNKSLELNAARLLRLYRDKNLGEFYADKILSEKERGAKEVVQKAESQIKITDEVAQKGVERTEPEVRAEEAAKEKQSKEKKRAAEKRTEEPSNEYQKRAADKLREIHDPKDLLAQIKEKIKNIKC